MKKEYPKGLQLKIIARFLDEKELDDFIEEYKLHRLKSFWGHYIPTEVDWKMFHDPKVTLEEWQKRWKIKNELTVLRRLGKMTINRDKEVTK